MEVGRCLRIQQSICCRIADLNSFSSQTAVPVEQVERNLMDIGVRDGNIDIECGRAVPRRCHSGGRGL